MQRNHVVFLCGLCVLIMCGLASGQVYVSLTGTNTNGSSWTTAFTSLQPAVTAAETLGEDVWVAEGTYPVAAAVNVPAGVKIYGGFPAAGYPGLADRDPASYPTILDAENAPTNIVVCVNAADTVLDGLQFIRSAGAGSNYARCGAVSCRDGGDVTINNCVFADNVALDSYGAGINLYYATATITNCRFLRGQSIEGGAIKLHLGDVLVEDCVFEQNNANGGGAFGAYESAVTIRRCRFSGNSTPGFGGGVECHEGILATIEDCQFLGNSAMEGGGLKLHSNNGIVSGCLFDGNSAGTDGGGISCYGSQLQVQRCVFTGNTGSNGAGGIDAHQNYGIAITNCLLAGNTSADHGGAFSMGISYQNHTITNCTVVGNSAPRGAGAYFKDGTFNVINTLFANNVGEAIFEDDAAQPASVVNCLFHDNTTVFTNTASLEILEVDGVSGINTLLAGAHDNIDGDPKFAGPLGYVPEYAIVVTSPCIDGGTSEGAPADDIVGQARPVEVPYHHDDRSGFDIGCYEKYINAITDSDGDLCPDLFELRNGYDPLDPESVPEAPASSLPAVCVLAFILALICIRKVARPRTTS